MQLDDSTMKRHGMAAAWPRFGLGGFQLRGLGLGSAVSGRAGWGGLGLRGLGLLGVLLAASSCSSPVRMPVCGNGVVEGRELCDDGNLTPGDGCDENCLLESREQCDNGEDDDGDGSADCADPDCATNPHCLGSEICTNGFDDDGDGEIDCDDSDCFDSVDCRQTERCDNGLDDDGDGQTDCDDSDCVGHPACGGCDPDQSLGILAAGALRSLVVDTAEAAGNAPPSCAGDAPAEHVRFEVAEGFHLRLSVSALSGTLVVALLREEAPGQTCETDELVCRAVGEDVLQLEETALGPGSYRVVVSSSETSGSGRAQISLSVIAASEELCDNGIDDNGDGLVDCADEACAQAPGCIVEQCDNGIDDDGDGLADCADPDCAIAAPCLPPEQCDNGIDDDLDGLADCADASCIGTGTCTGSACVVNADLGVLGRGAVVRLPFDTALATDDNRPSCGGDGPDVTFSFVLQSHANVVLSLEQTGDHVLALTTEAGPGSWCDEAERFCGDPGGSGRPLRVPVVDLSPARYFLLVDAVSGDRTGVGEVTVEVLDPLLELCDDGVDDDSDGLTDCVDPDCVADPVCLPEAACHDATDNDLDGYADCADFDCVGGPACGPGACVADRDLGLLSAGLPLWTSVDTTGAPDRFVTSCARLGGGGDVVLSFRVETWGDLRIDAAEHGFSDHAVALACQPGSGRGCDAAEHGCVIAGAPGLPISSVVPGIAPGRYFVLVEPYGPGGEGVMDLQLSLTPSP